MRAVVLCGLAACGFRGQEVAGGLPADAPRTSDTGPHISSDGAVDAPSSPDAPVIPVDAMADAGPLACPITTGWVTLGGGHYYFSPDGDDKHWSAAETDCEQRGAGFSSTHLAIIDSLQEGIDVGGHLVQVGSNVGGVASAWIGLFQRLLTGSKTTGWTEITAVTPYVNWASGEPNDANNAVELGTENFAWLDQPGDFEDAAGGTNLHYICECDGVAADFLTKTLVPLN
jgi:hypothetical protein